jgi:hypothetical protein
MTVLVPESKPLFNAVYEHVNAKICHGGPARPNDALSLIVARNAPSKIDKGTAANRDTA